MGRPEQQVAVSADPPLVGRRDALLGFDAALRAVTGGAFRYVALTGEPGAGKTRLLEALVSAAAQRPGAAAPAVLTGRAAEFEQELPFGVVVDALDDRLDEHGDALCSALGADTAALLATVFPSLPAVRTPAVPADPSGLARYRLYRAVRHLIEELAAPGGLVLILDDVHWADEASVELLDHLVRHPPRAGVLLATGYRPAQVSPRLAALIATAGGHGVHVTADPLTLPEVAEFLGPTMSRARCRMLHEASGGNPFYLEAMAKMDPAGLRTAGDDDAPEPELPPAIRAVLQVELSGLPEQALLVARAAAVASDEFDPALAAAAAQTSEAQALAALDELAARDVVRPAGSTGRFRFRHPLVRHAAYTSAAAGWRIAAHARIAGHLAARGGPATVRARHVERSAKFGDTTAMMTLIEAAQSVAPRAPATAALWLKGALRLLPADSEHRLDLLLRLASLQAVCGQLAEGREAAREVLRLLPSDDLPRRARAARFCAMIERLLGRPHESRALLLNELRLIPDPQSVPAVMLRLRLVAESLLRVDFRAAQAVLDLVPGSAADWDVSLTMAVAALRPMPAYAAGRIDEALDHIAAADKLVAAATDDQLAGWLDAVAWLCWTELLMGRYADALARFDRAMSVAWGSGQSYIVPTLLSGQAWAYRGLGRLAEAAAAAEEAMESARMLESAQTMVFALTQICLIASWSGDDRAAVEYGEQAVHYGGESDEWWGNMARYAYGIALLNAGRAEPGTAQIVAACDGLDDPALDMGTQVACCEALAAAAAARGDTAAALRWADGADRIVQPVLPVQAGQTALARAHALLCDDPAAAVPAAVTAARTFDANGQRLDAGRARLCAGNAAMAAGDRKRARTELRAAADIFAACGALTLHAQAVRAQRKAGVRVAVAAPRGPADDAPPASAPVTAPAGLSRRETEVARLVAAGHTNQQIADRLFLSVRTVETHLSHIFGKLGVTSRVGVANAFQRNPERSPEV